MNVYSKHVHYRRAFPISMHEIIIVYISHTHMVRMPSVVTLLILSDMLLYGEG